MMEDAKAPSFQNPCEETLEESMACVGFVSSGDDCGGSGLRMDVSVKENGESFEANANLSNLAGHAVEKAGEVVQKENVVTFGAEEKNDGGDGVGEISEFDHGFEVLSKGTCAGADIVEGVDIVESHAHNEAHIVERESDVNGNGGVNLDVVADAVVGDFGNHRGSGEKEDFLVNFDIGNSIVSLAGDGSAKLGQDEIVPDESMLIDEAPDLSGDDSSEKIEVSGDGISLFVEFRGPVGTAHDHVLEGSMAPGEELKGTISEEEEVKTENTESARMFSIGDVVWVKTKSQTWWPGKILDPSDAHKYGIEDNKREGLLVGYLGISHVSWCLPFQLKPLHENFEQMLKQNKSRSFVGAVEKAVDEFGNSLRMKLVCPCFVPDNHQMSRQADKGTRACILEGLGEVLNGLFEADNFLCRLKCLALSVSAPSMLEFSFMMNYLFAFYHSIGHHHLPMQLLRDTEEGGDDLEEKSFLSEKGLKMRKKGKAALFVLKGSGNVAEDVDADKPHSPSEEEAGSRSFGDFGSKDNDEKGFESRARKKSKYLSYPYVNWGNKQSFTEIQDQEALNESHEELDADTYNAQFVGSPSLVRCSSKKFQSKWLRKFPSESQDSTAELSSISSAEILSELRFAALDCQYPDETESFYKIGWFAYRLRCSSHHDQAIYEMHTKNLSDQKDVSAANPPPAENCEMKERSKREKIGKGQSSDTVASASPRSGRRVKTKSLSGLSDVNITFATTNSPLKDTPEMMNLLTTNGGYAVKKRVNRRGVNQLHAGSNKLCDGIPDLNGDNAGFGHSPAMGMFPEMEQRKKRRRRRKKEEVASELLKSLPEVNDSSANQLVPCLAVEPPLDSIASVSAMGKASQKKRKRMEKEFPDCLNPGLSSGIPDLNGTQVNAVLADVKLKPKRRRAKGGGCKERAMRKLAAGMRLEKVNAGTNFEAPGTALMLTFTPGSPLPSRDDLINTFSVFGPLKESETELMEDSNVAHVVFGSNADADEACRSLERDNPYGSALVKYQLHRFDTPARPSASRAQPGEAPSLDFIKQNLEMMTSMLENSGDNLSPETKVKLEAEIRNLLRKVSTMVTSSS